MYLQSSNLDEVSLNRSLLDDFQKGNFDIFYKKDDKDDSLIYFAVSKPRLYPKTLTFFFRVELEGEIYDSAGCIFDKEADGLTFAYYVKTKQESFSEEELKKVYSPYESFLKEVDEMGIEKYKKIKSANDLLASKLDSIIEDSDAPTGFQCRAVLNLSSIRGNLCSCTLLISSPSNPKLHESTAYYASDYYGPGRMTQEGIRGAFIDSTDPISHAMLERLISCINKHSGSYYSAYHNGTRFNLLIEELIGVLDVLRGQHIYLRKKNLYHVLPDYLPLNLSIDAEGKLHLDSKIPANLHLEGRYGFVIKDGTREIQLYDAKSNDQGKLISFFSSNPDIDPTLLNSNNVEKLYSLVSKTAKVDPTYAESIESRREKLKLYVDLDEKGRLVFRKEFIGQGGLVIPPEKALLFPTLSQKNSMLDSLAETLGFDFSKPIANQADIYRFLTMDLTPLMNCCTIMLSPELSNRRRLGSKAITIRVSYNNDWLNMSAESNELSDEEISKVLEAYRLKKKYARLNGKVILLDDKQLEEAAQLAEIGDIDVSDEGDYSIPLYKVFGLPEKPETFNIDVAPQIESIVGEIRDFKDSKFEPKPQFASVMRPYQLDGFKWLKVLSAHNLGGILADDMGLGKTLEMIAFISSYDDNKPILVVCPKSLIFNWFDEIKKWDPAQPAVVIAGDKSSRTQTVARMAPAKKVVYMISYDSLRQDVDMLAKVNFGLVVLDEAQYAKNTKAQKTKAIKRLNADQRFALTGTPIENSVWDMWSIFDFLMPGYLLSETRFASEYSGVQDLTDQYATRRLQSKVKPFVLRRTKEEVLKDLPPLTEETVTIEMKDKQREYYDSYLVRARKQALEDPKAKMEILRDLTRLRQICVDPGLFLENYTDGGEKMEYALELCKKAIENGHKVLIFSAFRTALDRLNKMFFQDHVDTYVINGDTPAQDRLKIAKAFNNPGGVRVCLISLKAGGTGLNLVGADIVIHLDPWWNVAAENQASDRAHRIGQNRPVTVYKLICRNSVEEKVITLQEMKKDLTDAFIADSDKAISRLTDEDIKFLLS